MSINKSIALRLELFQSSSIGPMPGEITGQCDPAGENIRAYEGQWTLDPNGGTWSDPETFPNARAFKFSGLRRGKDC